MASAASPSAAQQPSPSRPPSSAAPPTAAAPAAKYGNDDSTLFIASVFIGLLVLIGALVLASRLFGGKGGKATKRKPGQSSVKRTNTVVLCGPPGGGKTVLYLRLTGNDTTSVPQPVHHDPALSVPATHMSMTLNTGTVALPSGRSVPLVDYPGHPRLREGLFAHLESAGCVVLVVDGVAVLDETSGVPAAASLVLTMLQSPSFLNQGGPKRLIIAVSKKDDVACYTAKAVQKKLETELTRQLTTRAGAVGAIASENSETAAMRRADVLTLQEGEKFSFDKLSSVPVSFVECHGAARAGDKCAGLAALLDLLDETAASK